uniref:Zgc:92161 n=1 Tax=Hucho hucho TaxID=62062 RepID=A0A4W5RPY8_9TELE
MAAKACSVLITGANRGLGLEMVKQMVESPCPVRQLLACCRDLDGLRAEVRAELLLLEQREGIGDIQNVFVFPKVCKQKVQNTEGMIHFCFLCLPLSSGKPGMSCSKAAVSWFYVQSIVLYPLLFNTLPPFSLPAPPFLSSQDGLNMLALCATEEFRKDEILFAILHPGWVRTDMGGEGVSLTESVGLLRAMDSLTEKQTGAFLDYEGKVMPW